jgi:energy-coupling factor transport system permease protein
MLGVALFSCGGALIFGVEPQSIAMRLRRFLPLLAILVVMQTLFTRTGIPVLMVEKRVLVTSDGLVLGLNMVIRLFVILCSASVMATENSHKVIAALTQMGVPYLFSYMLLMALKFVPSFRTAFVDAITAIQIRGVNLRKVPFGHKLRLYCALVLPVVADAVVKAQDLAIAMEARGFGALPKRTSNVQVNMSRLDWLVTILLIGMGGVAFGVYYLA